MEFTNDIVFALYRLSLFLIPSNIRLPSMSVSMLCKYGFTTKKRIKNYILLLYFPAFILFRLNNSFWENVYNQ